MLALIPHRLVATEEILRERSRQIVELEVKGSRLQKENIMLEERNKMLITHVQLSASSPSPNEVRNKISLHADVSRTAKVNCNNVSTQIR